MNTKLVLTLSALIALAQTPSLIAMDATDIPASGSAEGVADTAITMPAQVINEEELTQADLFILKAKRGDFGDSIDSVTYAEWYSAIFGDLEYEENNLRKEIRILNKHKEEQSELLEIKQALLQTIVDHMTFLKALFSLDKRKPATSLLTQAVNIMKGSLTVGFLCGKIPSIEPAQIRPFLEKSLTTLSQMLSSARTALLILTEKHLNHTNWHADLEQKKTRFAIIHLVESQPKKQNALPTIEEIKTYSLRFEEPESQALIECYRNTCSDTDFLGYVEFSRKMTLVCWDITQGKIPGTEFSNEINRTALELGVSTDDTSTESTESDGKKPE